MIINVQRLDMFMIISYTVDVMLMNININEK